MKLGKVQKKVLLKAIMIRMGSLYDDIYGEDASREEKTAMKKELKLLNQLILRLGGFVDE